MKGVNPVTASPPDLEMKAGTAGVDGTEAKRMRRVLEYGPEPISFRTSILNLHKLPGAMPVIM